MLLRVLWLIMKYDQNIVPSVYAKRDLGTDTAELQIWSEGHKSKCLQNFLGSPNAMEVAAAEIIWKRSISTGIRYCSILSDGDAKTFHHLLNLNIYGDDFKICKEECINLVAKCEGVGLRNKVKE